MNGLEERKAWQDVFPEHPLRGRKGKPRSAGLTMVLDKGLALGQTKDLLELASDYIDMVKLSFGSAALYPERILRQKISLIRTFGVDVCPGGTFLEIAVLQGRIVDYLRRADELGFSCIEVSDGTMEMTREERRSAIHLARAAGFKVISEVGKKEVTKQLSPLSLQQQTAEDLRMGVYKVIIEGRESGKSIGIYDEKGLIKENELEAIAHGIPDLSNIMWEAPLKEQQQALIRRFGPNVNLGNILPDEVIALESLRCGLRSDTLKLCLEGGRFASESSLRRESDQKAEVK